MKQGAVGVRLWTGGAPQRAYSGHAGAYCVAMHTAFMTSNSDQQVYRGGSSCVYCRSQDSGLYSRKVVNGGR